MTTAPPAVDVVAAAPVMLSCSPPVEEMALIVTPPAAAAPTMSMPVATLDAEASTWRTGLVVPLAPTTKAVVVVPVIVAPPVAAGTVTICVSPSGARSLRTPTTRVPVPMALRRARTCVNPTRMLPKLRVVLSPRAMPVVPVAITASELSSVTPSGNQIWLPLTSVLPRVPSQNTVQPVYAPENSKENRLSPDGTVSVTACCAAVN